VVPHQRGFIAVQSRSLSAFKCWNSTGPTLTPTPIPTPKFSRVSSRECMRVVHSACHRNNWQSAAVVLPVCQSRIRMRILADLSTDLSDARFSSRGCPLGMRTCTRTVHDKLPCTRLQNYTIGASLMSVSVSVSVWSRGIPAKGTSSSMLARTLTSPRRDRDSSTAYSSWMTSATSPSSQQVRGRPRYAIRPEAHYINVYPHVYLYVITMYLQVL